MPLPAAVLLLAAGASRRFGQDKRRAPMPGSAGGGPGGSLLEATIRSLAILGWPLTLVLRADDQAYGETLRQQLRDLGAEPPIDCVYAPDSSLGMGHSLAAGARALERRGTRRLLIALGDMPYLRRETLTTLAAAVLDLDPDRPGVVRPRFQGQAGHPVGLSGLALEALTNLTGDQGARALLQRWTAATRWLEVDDSGVVRDVDRPADLN
ncbi:MAG: nucleotidyltransferase family protein [Pseudomonadota bacterium]